MSLGRNKPRKSMCSTCSDSIPLKPRENNTYGCLFLRAPPFGWFKRQTAPCVYIERERERKSHGEHPFRRSTQRLWRLQHPHLVTCTCRKVGIRPFPPSNVHRDPSQNMLGTLASGLGLERRDSTWGRVQFSWTNEKGRHQKVGKPPVFCKGFVI